jgi:serine protease AprX
MWVVLGLGDVGDVRVRLGEVRGRIAAMAATVLLVANLVPGTNWTLAPIDPALASGGYALISVGRGAAGAIAEEARGLGASDVAALGSIGVVTARFTPSALDGLRRDRRVAFIASDEIVTAASDDRHFERPDGKPSVGNEAIQARQAWSTATGRGVVVAVMDTGIADHPDLEGSVIARFDFVNDGATSLDPGGHGTFVAGLIAAHGRTFSGVAPDAKLISLRVLDAQGRGTMHSVLAAFDWVLHNRAGYQVKVLNLSFGAPQTTTYNRTLLAGVVESAWFAGVTVVTAAGNGGPKMGTVAMPGADPFVVTVGSFDDHGTVTTNDDRESIFSSRGPTLDGFAKPDLLAPGEHVLSLRVPGASLERSGDGGGGYARLSGTSASSAFTSGAAALVLQAHPTYSATEVKGALVAGGRRIAGTRTPGLDAAEALTARPARVNAGLKPSLVLLAMLKSSGALGGAGTTWEGISWESVSWETVSWDAVSWEGIAWESVSWDAVSWDLLGAK